jgi:hypothetical protein
MAYQSVPIFKLRIISFKAVLSTMVSVLHQQTERKKSALVARRWLN